MILGLGHQPAASCFVEIDEAVRQLRGRDDVVFNAHAFPDEIPEGAVVYNLENVPQQVRCNLFDSWEVWDFSALNVFESSQSAGFPWRHVPVGYHPSMERFTPAKEKDIDVIFCGHPNERRNCVIDQLLQRGLHVVQMPHGIYGKERDELLGRAKLALNMLYYDNGTFPALRVAHLVANRVPVLSECCPEGWEYVPTVKYEDLSDRAYDIVTRRREYRDHLAESAYLSFRMHPMELPQ